MEKLYPPGNFSCTEQISLKSYFQKFSEKIGPQMKNNPTLEDTFSYIYGMDIKADQFSSLLESCNLEKLTVDGEVKQADISDLNKFKVRYRLDFDKQEDPQSSLCTLQAQKDDLKKTLRKRDSDDIPLQFQASDVVDFAPGQEILVTVRVYHPFSCSMLGKDASKLRPSELKFSQEIQVLGSQTLAVLRDKIFCINDKSITVTVEDINSPVPSRNKDDFPSGLICINDHLFIDMRYPKAVDYSVPIKKWGKDRNIGNFISQDMKNVTIEEIVLRIGYPYVYQHLGDCEHILVFSDAKLVKRTDSLCRNDYPYYKNVAKCRTPSCGICQAASATWMCVDCDRLPNDRTLLCDNCLKSYNYIDGKKIGDFKVYPYINRSTID